MPISERAKDVAREIARRRLLVQDPSLKNDVKTALAEVAVLDLYNRLPTVDDLHFGGKKLYLDPVDDNGRTIRIATGNRWPLRVWSRALDKDCIVFAVTEPEPAVMGWLPTSEIESFPVEWWVEDGQRKDYWHEVEAGFLISMPEKFDLVDPCAFAPHEDFGGMWNYSMDAWECFGCGRFIYDERVLSSVRKERQEAEDNARKRAEAATAEAQSISTKRKR